MLAFKIRFQKLEREAPSTNRMCSKFKEANDFPSGKKVKWQESDVHEMANDIHEMASDVHGKKVTLSKNHFERSKIS